MSDHVYCVLDVPASVSTIHCSDGVGKFCSSFYSLWQSTNSFCAKCLYQVRAIDIAVFPVFRLLTDFVCLLKYEFYLSLWKIARCSVILLLPLWYTMFHDKVFFVILM